MSKKSPIDFGKFLDDLGGNPLEALNGLFQKKSQVVACRACGQKNRVSNAKLDSKPRCGKCGIPIPVDKK